MSRLTCPHCRQAFDASDDALPETCPHCGGALQTGASAPAAEEDAAAEAMQHLETDTVADARAEVAMEAEAAEALGMPVGALLPDAAPGARSDSERKLRAVPSFSRMIDADAAKPRTAPWQWIALAVLALVLCLQILVADRARLAGDARWRPLLEATCGALHCDLPAWREPKAFAMLARSVTPAGDGVLLAQASFRNDARWAQPWPTVVLSLSDANGRVLGAREFGPRDYLDGNADAGAALAPGQVAQIALRLHEPAGGVDAFNYEFR